MAHINQNNWYLLKSVPQRDSCRQKRIESVFTNPSQLIFARSEIKKWNDGLVPIYIKS